MVRSIASQPGLSRVEREQPAHRAEARRGRRDQRRGLKVCPLPQALQGVGPHAPAIKHAPYAAREGALAGKSERDAHHAAGHETMANLAGKGFGALRAAAGVANPTPSGCRKVRWPGWPDQASRPAPRQRATQRAGRLDWQGPRPSAPSGGMSTILGPPLYLCRGGVSTA